MGGMEGQGMAEYPRKQQAMAGRDDRPFQAREMRPEVSSFTQSFDKLQAASRAMIGENVRELGKYAMLANDFKI